jgi:hypothetical protein
MEPQSRIISAQTLLEIYEEAWNFYMGLSSTGSASEHPEIKLLRPDLPYWIGTKELHAQKWTEFVYSKLFILGIKSTWRRAPFLILYEELKAIYIALAPGVDVEADWTTYFQSQIGRSIMLMFNGDSRKEVNTSYRLRTSLLRSTGRRT